jgi:hypothetical protein
MSSETWTVFFWVFVILFVGIMWFPVKWFFEALKRKKTYLRGQATLKNESDQQFIDDSYADESTHPPVHLKVQKFSRDLNWIDDYEEGADKRLDVLPPRNPHRHRWIFVGRVVGPVHPWPEAYEFECIADYYCQSKLRMDIEPMWGFVPRKNPFVTGFDRTRYKDRAAYMREMNHPMNPMQIIVLPERTE